MREVVLLPSFLASYGGRALPYTTSSGRRVPSTKACNPFVCVRACVFLDTCFVFRMACLFCVSHALFSFPKVAAISYTVVCTGKNGTPGTPDRRK